MNFVVWLFSSVLFFIKSTKILLTSKTQVSKQQQKLQKLDNYAESYTQLLQISHYDEN